MDFNFDENPCTWYLAPVLAVCLHVLTAAPRNLVFVDAVQVRHYLEGTSQPVVHMCPPVG